MIECCQKKKRCAALAQSRLISLRSPGLFSQVLDVERMVAKNTMPQTQDQGAGTNLENHPVIRTLYDHMDVRILRTRR